MAGRKPAYHDPCPCPVPVPVPDLDPSRGHDDAVMAVHARARAPIVAAGVVRWVQKED